MPDIYGWHLTVALREPENWERDASCNGCHAPTVYRMLEVGSQENGRNHGHGSQFRLCRECTRQLVEGINAGAAKEDDHG